MITAMTVMIHVNGSPNNNRPAIAVNATPQAAYTPYATPTAKPADSVEDSSTNATRYPNINEPEFLSSAFPRAKRERCGDFDDDRARQQPPHHPSTPIVAR